MANHEINEEQEAVNKALRMIETSDPVHADVYNALFSILINNDVFLEKLANKMVQQVMISHVMDSTNPDMVMGADQGPVITKLIEKVREQVNVLNTNQIGKAPISHASTANTYGLGTASVYGHVKLSDTYNSSAGAAANGVGASSKAINEVYKKFNAENTVNTNSNTISISSSTDDYTDIASLAISPGVYAAIGRIEFQSSLATGDRKGRIAFSASSGTNELATECIRAASANWPRLSVCDIFKTNVSGTIKVQGSQNSGNAMNTAGWITCVRLKAL